jgi:lipopolysaccharide/colanic/teichoic acid biosynthesis glycosyltransferase
MDSFSSLYFGEPNLGAEMRVGAPTSSERTRRFIRTVDILSAFLAAPIAVVLRDPSLFSGVTLAPTVGYCLIAFAAALLMVIVFHLGQSVYRQASAREARSVVAASLAGTALSTVCSFSIYRLDYVPRSLPVIQVLVLCALLLGGRVIATFRRGSRGQCASNYLVDSHTLLVSANSFCLSYLKMLDAFNVDRTNLVAILDHNPKLFGRAVLGNPIIGPPSAIARVIREYRVHGVDIARVLICENRPKFEDSVWNEIEQYCNSTKVELKFLSDVLGFELVEPIEDNGESEEPEVESRGHRFAKRALDLLMCVAMAIAISPIVTFIAISIMIDLGWPIIFWQKRIGYRGRPFLVFKFRTLHAPYNRQGDFVEEDRRTSRFGSFLRRARLDELPQLWNIVCGEMSFVGPRPLLPIDQPKGSQLRLQMKPGVTGWAQINGGRQITADEKGTLDEWYVRNASVWLDIGIILRTVLIVLFGDQWNVSHVAESVETDRLDGQNWSPAMAAAGSARSSPRQGRNGG